MDITTCWMDCIRLKQIKKDIKDFMDTLMRATQGYNNLIEFNYLPSHLNKDAMELSKKLEEVIYNLSSYVD